MTRRPFEKEICKEAVVQMGVFSVVESYTVI